MDWDGTIVRSDYKDHIVEAHDQLADAAKSGDWDTVFETLGNRGLIDANSVRIGGKSRYSPLHQAAWRAESADIARRLLQLGAYRTIRNAAGERPIDIAGRRGAYHLIDDLRPQPKHPLEDWAVFGLEYHLHRHIQARLKDMLPDIQLRLPQIGPLTELTTPKFWFPVPGLYGGFDIELTGEHQLTVKSMCRVAGGWAETHEITPGASRLIDRGWDI
jgi:hypothetical protein